MGISDEALGVIPGRTTSSGDLGGSSKYSNEAIGSVGIDVHPCWRVQIELDNPDLASTKRPSSYRRFASLYKLLGLI